MPSIIDTNHPTTSRLPELAALGVRTIIRYIHPGSPGSPKTLKPPEAQAIAAAGLRAALVCEGGGGFAQHAICGETGARDGAVCRGYAPTIGAPAGAAIYFAVDVDADNDQIRDLVRPYFAAIGEAMRSSGALPAYRIGVYGSGAVCSAMLDVGLAELAWLSCSSGWRGYMAFKTSGRWNLLQHTPTKLAGLDVDPNDTNPARPDIGDFPPWGAAGAVGAPHLHDIRWVQTALNTLGAAPPLVVDGIVGPRTERAVRAFQQDHGLRVDGVPGPHTVAALAATLARR